MPRYPNRTPFERAVDGIITPEVPGDILSIVANQSYGVAWDESADTYERTGAQAGLACGVSHGDAINPIQAGIRGCLLNNSGIVQYYTNATDRTKKAGTTIASDLTGADGQVMQQIPAFYYRYAYSGTTHTWEISQAPLAGFSLHPAFIKNDEFVPYRYIGAYEGSMYDAGTAAMIPDADIEVNIVVAAGDLLCSVSNEYPKTNQTRADFRTLASQRGTGWRNQDFDLISAIQLLYLVEYADFDSQSTISNGRTMFNTGTWEAANQGLGKYIGETGYSNGDGNASGGHSRASAVSISAINTDTDVNYHDYMSYRGIENFFGNVWNWVDGINIEFGTGIDYTVQPYVSNNDTDFADDVTTNYTQLARTIPGKIGDVSQNGFQDTLCQQDRGFLPASTGASSSTKITDYYVQATGWRVVMLGGLALHALSAGAFDLSAGSASSKVGVDVGGRLAF